MARNQINGLVYPRFYYQRGQKSDRNWILHRMQAIPEKMRVEVAEKYEQIYLGNNQGRKQANNYLNGLYLEIKNNA
jgi:hypothetical protein